jgi:hypothetical protein
VVARILAALLLAASLSACAVDSVPAQFRGVWSANPTDCTAADKEKVILSAKELIFYYSGGPVEAVLVHDDHDISLVASLSTIMHIDIDIANDEEKFEIVLSKTGDELTFHVARGGDVFRRQRCRSPQIS